MSDMPPGESQRYRLPAGVQSRFQSLLDKQDKGQPLTEAERSEAEARPWPDGNT